MGNRKSFVTMVLVVTLIFAGVVSARAAEAPQLLWPEGAPGALGDADEDTPTVTFMPAPKANNTGAALIICPGGGYYNIMMDYEGQEMGEWANSIGVTGVVLKYRLTKHGYHHPAWLQDAQRAISYVRSKAEEYGIDPNRIGIGGFSAGGHLASTCGVHYDRRSYEAVDAIDKVSCKPNYMILVYPGITSSRWSEDYRKRVLGPDAAADLADYLSTDQHVTSETPPTFLVHGHNDATVSPEQSITFYLACREAGVPAELHIYLDGPHGFGMGQLENTKAVTSHSATIGSWPGRCEGWMRTLKLLEKQ